MSLLPKRLLVTRRSALFSASLAAVVLTVLAMLFAHDEGRLDADEAARRLLQARLKLWNTPLADGRCAIKVASFGGGRTQLIRAEKDGTIHFAVVEVPTRASLLRPEIDWLKLQFGTAETALLGAFRSKDAALRRAGLLCPPKLRCLPGRPGCPSEPTVASPVEMFTKTLVSPASSDLPW